MTGNRRRAALLNRLSRPFTDVVLLAQLLGVAANLIWYSELSTADWVGFVYLGGDIAGLFAYFGFVLFGILFFWLAPRRFWLSLHPITLGIALLMLASHRLWSANGLYIITAALIGAFIGRIVFIFVLHHPRIALLTCALLIPFGRYAMPRFAAPYAITFFGALLIMLVCTPPLLHYLRQR